MCIRLINSIVVLAACIPLVSCSGNGASTERFYTLTVNPPANGKITGGGIDCGAGALGDCTKVVNNGANVVLTAIAVTGYRIGSWTGCTSATDSCTVTMSTDKTVGASFVQTRTLTVTPPTNGKITGTGIDCGGNGTDCSEVVDSGTSVILTATPATGYRFGSWIGCASTTSSCILIISTDKTVGIPIVKYPNERIDMFIAHEGGGIDGHTYTDCLEALNLSYEKGARMFELDIIKTADNVFVAAHDWSWFGEISGNLSVSDSNPMTWQEFLAQKIWNKYTPLDIYAINKWFGDHPDSILVTDKINTPKEFSDAFLYKDRLIMELFTWGAVQEAVDSGIKAMPTSELVFGRSDIEAKLAALDIKYIAISRRQIDANKDLLKRLKNNGIKAYAFLLDSEHDENYVFKNEMEWLAGMYADDLGLILNPP